MKTSTKVLGLALGMALAAAAPATAAELKMMTGPQGGSWIPLGGQLKDMWEKAVPGLSVQIAAGRRHRQCARRRGRQGRYRLRQFDLDGRRHRRQGAVQQAARQCLQRRDALSAIFPVGRACRFRHEHGQGPQGQELTTQQRGNTGELITAPALEGERPHLQRRQGELRRRYTDSVTQMQDGHARRLRARHHDPGRRDDGSCLGARDQAARPVATARQDAQAQSRATS